jgi:hypothetical protein
MNKSFLKVAAFALILVACAYFGNYASAQNAAYQQMKNHLSYKGYKCDIDVQGKLSRLRCTTDKAYPNFSIRPQSGGYLLSSYFSGSQYAKRHRAAFLNMVNNLNVLAITTRYYVDRDTDLALEAWIGGEVYERSSFEATIDNFNTDWDRIFSKFGDEIRTFLR